jgi:putative oxidoreductase
VLATITEDQLALGMLLLRVAAGIVMIAHGYNHIWGGGKIAGTARWFASLGMKPGIVHAWFASITELGAGVMLIAGFLTPLAAAGLLGVMTVALIINHLKNGFFIFRPGEGYEYVGFLSFAALAIGTIGAGEWSLDEAFDSHMNGWTGLVVTAVAGIGGGLALLAACWRPVKK